ncbi:hypothetical protein A2U01_0070346, partial [Trifolium medium]|nr:hypothetical protein [Trifolium medium]
YQINLAEYTRSYQLIHQVVNPRKWILILNCSADDSQCTSAYYHLSSSPTAQALPKVTHSV